MTRAWSPEDAPHARDLTVIVTGANAGLGLQAAKALAQRGARVVLACRDARKADGARAKILREVPDARLDVAPLDLGDLASVKDCAEIVGGRYDRIDRLVCNAGIMAVPYGRTKDGIELHMGVNYYGHYALVARLLPLLHASPAARVVTVSSLAEKMARLRLDEDPAEEDYGRWRAYADSKLAVLMLALILDERFRSEGRTARALSAHPGFTQTELRTTRLETERDPWQRMQMRFYEWLSVPVERGVLPVLWAAMDPAAEGGQYVGLSGFAEIRGWPRVTRAQRRAYDGELRARLLAVSERITGLRLDVSGPPATERAAE